MLSDDDAALLQEVGALADEDASPERTARLLELTRRADEEDLVNAALIARLALTHDAILDGDQTTLVTALAAAEDLTARAGDRLEPEYVPGIFVQYLAVLFTIMRRPDVPVARVEAVADSLGRHCRQLGHPDREHQRVRLLMAYRRGDTEAADDWFRQWQAEPVDELLPEFADTVVTWLAAEGRHGEAVAVHAAALERADDPAVVGMLHAAVLLPLVALGRVDEAERRHREGLEGGLDAPQVGQHLTYQALTGALDDSHRLMLDAVAALPGTSAWAAGELARGAVPLLRRLRTAGRGAERLGAPDEDGGETVDALFARLVTVAEDVAVETDRVNDLDGLTLARLHRFWATH